MVESFLTEPQVLSILDFCKTRLILEEAKLSRDSNNDVRKSMVAFTNLNDFEFLHTLLIKELNRHFIFDGYEIDMNVTYQFTKYNVGDYYNWHTDSGQSSQAKRKISVVILLNEDYVGGDLVLKIGGEEVIANKKTGNMFLFNSSTLHKVTPVESGVRYSLVTWLGLKETINHQKKLI